eukprot:3935760-Rhodomonas_salina.2
MLLWPGDPSTRAGVLCSERNSEWSASSSLSVIQLCSIQPVYCAILWTRMQIEAKLRIGFVASREVKCTRNAGRRQGPGTLGERGKKDKLIRKSLRRANYATAARRSYVASVRPGNRCPCGPSNF